MDANMIRDHRTTAVTTTVKYWKRGFVRQNHHKYTSCPDWCNPHMPITVTASSGQFVTRASRLPG